MFGDNDLKLAQNSVICLPPYSCRYPDLLMKPPSLRFSPDLVDVS